MTRWHGIAGVAGAALFLAGDLLFNGHLGPGDRYASGMQAMLRNAPDERIFAGGLAGPPAACLCMLGFWYFYRNVRPQSQLLARVMLAASWVFWVGSGAVHTLWAAKGLALKYCSGEQSDCVHLSGAIRNYWSLSYNLVAIPGYLLAFLLLYLILFKKTLYPRWIVVAHPAIWLWLFPLLPSAPAPFGAILVGGIYNFSWVAFFLVSLLTTWKQVPPDLSGASQSS